MKRATVEDMRRIERLAVERGDSYENMMERAGTAVADWLADRREISARTLTVVCGKGNNGGDGFVIARRLCAIAKVTVILADGHPATDIAAKNLGKLSDLPVTVMDYGEEPYLCAAAIHGAEVLVDAVFGIGFHGGFDDKLRPLLREMNAADGFKLAVDAASGINADTGVAAADTFRADKTLTFTAIKTGLPIAEQSGDIEVLDIGIPAETVEEVLGQRSVTPEMVKACFRPRPADSHKGTFGTLLTVCGSFGMAGAAMLCARGALRSGAGLVTAAVPRSVYPLMAPVLPEAVFRPMAETENGQFSASVADVLRAEAAKADAVVIGCGLGQGDDVSAVVEELVCHRTVPTVLDADGINAIAPHILTEETACAPLILTPHPGEMARLIGISVAEVQAHREEIARRFADETGAIVVLKGYHTLIAAPGRSPLQNETGNPGMATGGSGDVLAGIIGGLLAQGMPPYQAAFCGVYIHGLAGDKAAERLSQHGMLPSDLLDELGGVFLPLEK